MKARLDRRAPSDHKARRVSQAQEALRDLRSRSMASLAMTRCLALKDYKDRKVLLERRAHKALSVQPSISRLKKVTKARMDRLVLKAHKASKVSQARKAQLVPLFFLSEARGTKAHTDHRALKAYKAAPVQRVRRALLVPLSI